MKKLIFVNSHPAQYFVPLYAYLTESGIDTEVWFCSDEPLKGSFDKQFNVKLKWDIPLVAGYKALFFKNHSWKPSHHNGFFGLMNLGLIRAFFKQKNAVFVVHGWHYFTLFIILAFARFSSNRICFRIETPLNQDVYKKGFKTRIRRFFQKHVIFPGINNFLYIGKQNKAFFLASGVSEDQLVFCPYAVDNKRFRDDYLRLKEHRIALREELGLPISAKVIVSMGKYIYKKRPLDILESFRLLQDDKAWLVMVGEGGLRPEMEAYIQKYNLKQVVLTGFINQSQVTKYYAVADVYVMASGNEETWGLATNEAMNFNLPIVLSDRVGGASDLVVEGSNGYTYPLGDCQALATKLHAIFNKELSHAIISEEIIKKYSFKTISSNLIAMDTDLKA